MTAIRKNLWHPRHRPRVTAEDVVAARRAAGVDPSEIYQSVVARFTFAPPSEQLLDEVARHAPILDVGAGNGYWSWRLQERGVDVVAVEPRPDAHRPVIETLRTTGQEIAPHHPDRALLMVWPTGPRGDSSWAGQTVAAYTGSTVLYLGDPAFSYTADQTLPLALTLGGFRETNRIVVDSWPGQFRADHLITYERNT